MKKDCTNCLFGKYINEEKKMGWCDTYNRPCNEVPKELKKEDCWQDITPKPIFCPHWEKHIMSLDELEKRTIPKNDVFVLLNMLYYGFINIIENSEEDILTDDWINFFDDKTYKFYKKYHKAWKDR